MIRLIAPTLIIFALAVPAPGLAAIDNHPFEVKKAEWNVDDSELRVKGKTSSDDLISIRYALDWDAEAYLL